MPCPSFHQSWNHKHSLKRKRYTCTASSLKPFFLTISRGGPDAVWSKMKLNRGKSVCDQRWKACLGVLLASALAFAATHRCGHLLHYLLTSIVLLGGIARYWRPGLGVGDHRPLVVLLRKQVKFNAEVGEAMGKIRATGNSWKGCWRFSWKLKSHNLLMHII